MAHGLPNLMVIRYLNGYAYCTIGPKACQGYVGWKEVSVTSPLTKIEVETAKTNSKYVHLRFCYNNKYWARVGAGTDDLWLVASSDQPEEDKSKWSCTLFEPIVKKDQDYPLHLIHVQTGKYVQVNLECSDYLYVGGEPSDFRLVDWNSLVTLPKHVAFKGDNGKYLRSTGDCLEFSSGEGNEEETAYEVTMNPHGYLLVKSKYSGKYWRGDYWVRDNSTDAGTFFWPVKVDDKTIALRAESNKNFCKRFTQYYTNGLCANVPTITAEARFQVEELVLERQIYDITYHMDKARIYDQRPLVLGDGSAANRTNKEANLTLKVSYEDISTYSFKNSFGIKSGVASTIKTGIPFIVDGKLKVSAEVFASFEWNRETKKSLKQEATYEAVVSPESSIRVKYVATEAKCDVPFSYTQRDKLSRDGSFVATKHIDGVFTGVNYYSFHFEQD